MLALTASSKLHSHCCAAASCPQTGNFGEDVFPSVVDIQSPHAKSTTTASPHPVFRSNENTLLNCAYMSPSIPHEINFQNNSLFAPV